jgi:hypothetical protein
MKPVIWEESMHPLINFRALSPLALALAAFFMIPPQQAAADLTLYTCKSVDVSTYEERIHVRCSKAASGGIWFFAVPTANSAYAARILSILTAAHIAGKNIEIQYDPNDKSGDQFGCGATDCRRIVSVGIK